jgi:polysaccharide export outer membrane protein
MSFRSIRRAAAASALVAGLAFAGGCTMPRPVASFSDVQSAGKAGDIELIPVSAKSIPVAAQAAESGFPASFFSRPAVSFDALGPGDKIGIHIWESGTPTITSANGGGSDLGEMTVDEEGRISVPYAGTLHAAGMTLAELRNAIRERLRTVVLNPQVDVRMIEHRSALVSVQGDAAKTGSVPIEQGRTRLGQLLADVAPDQKSPEMLSVIVRRNGASGEVRLSDIYADPKLDIPLHPGDSVILHQLQQNVTVLGAAGVQGQVPITKRNFTLVDAIGAARGLDPNMANPRAVFLMRANPDPKGAPLVYQFDMRKPQALAFAGRTVLRDSDAVLISSAPFAQIRLALIAFAQSMSGLRSAATIPVL